MAWERCEQCKAIANVHRLEGRRPDGRVVISQLVCLSCRDHLRRSWQDEDLTDIRVPTR